MNRTTKNLIIDSILIILMILTSVTGLLVWLVFPYELGYEIIPHFLEEIHKWVSLLLVAFSAYHLISHWAWYKKTFRSTIKRKKY